MGALCFQHANNKGELMGRIRNGPIYGQQEAGKRPFEEGETA